MIDKPIAAKIVLTLNDSSSTGEEFIGLSGTLYRQNLIFSEPRELRRNNHVLELIVIFRDINSFETWTNNQEILEYWTNQFNTLLSIRPQTLTEENVIVEVDNLKNCACKKSDFYILQGRTFQFADELTCKNCLGQISYSKVPLAIEIEEWQSKYERVYLNWLESGLFEKEANRELTSYTNGKLNIEGERIRKQVSEYFGIPVYIRYFVEDYLDNYTCPICGDLGIESGLEKPKKICLKCNSIFDFSDNP